MKLQLIFCCLWTFTMAVKSNDWESFKINFHRKYKNPTEEAFRKKIFLNNKMLIDQHNRRYSERKTTFTMGVNQFADLTNLEFKERMNHYTMAKSTPVNRNILPSIVAANETAVDWRTTGCVTDVKDQGQCGGCWAFSATGSIEFIQCIKSDALVSLSEQNLLDCTYEYGNVGCSGGSMDFAFQYVIDNNGIDTEETYPYEANSVTGNCRYNFTNRGASLIGFVDIFPSGDENALLNAVAIGAVSVAIDASQNSFQLYTSGVYDEPSCSSSVMDHSVLAVGYGTDPVGGDYWLVKNSWGTSWGEAGYINMSRNKENQCGIATQASYPISPIISNSIP